jgi:hypothetical protein
VPKDPKPRPITGGAGSNPGKPVIPTGNKGRGGTTPPRKNDKKKEK